MSSLNGSQRAQLLAALAGWFERPRPSSVSAVPDNHLLCALGAATEANPEGPWSALFDQLWELIQGCETEPALHELELEHARLFLNPSKLRISPNEHAYSSRGVAELDSEMREIYARRQLQPGSRARGLADHISMELEFMAWLLSEGQECEAQTFFEQHLLSFHPRCSEELRQRTNNPFHRIVAETLLTCMQLESRQSMEAPMAQPS